MKLLKYVFHSDDEKFTDHINKWLPIAIIIGLVVGIAMGVFAATIVLLAAFFDMFGVHPLITMLIGGAIIIILVFFKFDAPGNNGINYVISTKHEGKSIPILSALKKFLTSAVTIASGLPVGREGPALIVGSSISTKIAAIMDVQEKDIPQAITLGSAAATGAFFQAPFGSAIFAAEFPYKEDADEPMLMIAFVASVISAVTANFLATSVQTIIHVNYELFELGSAMLPNNLQIFLLAVLLGLLAGVLGRLFVFIYDLYLKFNKYLSYRFQLSYIELTIGLLITIALIAVGNIFIPDYYLAQGLNSFEGIERFVKLPTHESSLIFLLFLAIFIQMLATTAIIGSNFPGGIFGPALATGALFGIFFATVFGFTEAVAITAFAIIGMSAVHAATTKTPIASVVLILEITGLPNLIVPIIAANVFSYLISGSNSLYKGQLRSRDVKLLKELKSYDPTGEYNVADVMTRDVILADFHSTVGEFRQIIATSGKRDFPVVVDNSIYGVISEDNITNLANETPIADYINKHHLQLHQDASGSTALNQMLNADVERSPVVDSAGKLLGIVSIRDIINGYRKLSA